MAIRKRYANASSTVQAFRTGETRMTAIEIERKSGNTQQLYLQLFNAISTNVVLGTTAPVMVLPINAGRQTTLNSVNYQSRLRTRFTLTGNEGGVLFGTAMSLAVTTTPSGSTAPTAGQEPTITAYGEPIT